MNAPCKDCTDRHIHCHSECEKYKAFVAENEKRKAELYKENQAKSNYIDHWNDFQKRKKNGLKNYVRRRKK